VGQVGKIFQNMPNPLEWHSFLNHNHSLLTDIYDEIKEISDKNQLNKEYLKNNFPNLFYINNMQLSLYVSLIIIKMKHFNFIFKF